MTITGLRTVKELRGVSFIPLEEVRSHMREANNTISHDLVGQNLRKGANIGSGCSY